MLLNKPDAPAFCPTPAHRSMTALLGHKLLQLLDIVDGNFRGPRYVDKLVAAQRRQRPADRLDGEAEKIGYIRPRHRKRNRASIFSRAGIPSRQGQEEHANALDRAELA